MHTAERLNHFFNQSNTHFLHCTVTFTLVFLIFFHVNSLISIRTLFLFYVAFYIVYVLCKALWIASLLTCAIQKNNSAPPWRNAMNWKNWNWKCLYGRKLSSLVLEVAQQKHVLADCFCQHSFLPYKYKCTHGIYNWQLLISEMMAHQDVIKTVVWRSDRQGCQHFSVHACITPLSTWRWCLTQPWNLWLKNVFLPLLVSWVSSFYIRQWYKNEAGNHFY